MSKKKMVKETHKMEEDNKNEKKNPKSHISGSLNGLKTSRINKKSSI